MIEVDYILSKLKYLLGYKHDKELASLLGVKPGTISSWRTRGALRFDKIINLCKIYNIDLNELFLIKSNRNNKDVKLVMVPVEYHLLYFLNPVEYISKSFLYSFPTEENVDIAFQIGFNNMYPTLVVSSYVLAKKIDLKDIQPLNLYVIVVQEKGILFHRYQSDTNNDEFVFSSDNPHFKNFLVKVNDILEIFCIKGLFIPHAGR
ncbi:helix-turn-helix domain-containing protein [Myroides sp. TSA_177.3]|uniref:helix-turn-helix domain-containing protein n=1 Tax=Myroides sp. TSA_177.3 TaxID=3415650 RepID=UPI004045AF17